MWSESVSLSALLQDAITKLYEHYNIVNAMLNHLDYWNLIGKTRSVLKIGKI